MMPANAEIVKVDMKGDEANFWALVETEATTEAREFSVFFTGDQVPDNWIYRGTWQRLGSDHIMLFHLFEIPKEKQMPATWKGQPIKSEADLAKEDLPYPPEPQP